MRTFSPRQPRDYLDLELDNIEPRHADACQRRVRHIAQTLHMSKTAVTLLVQQLEARLLDFFHVCDYLSTAAKAIATTEEAAKAWMEIQKDRLKRGLAQSGLDALKPHQEGPRVEDDQAPVRVCHRYLSLRLNHLHYDEALRQDLPIGSGEIESAHRYLVQQRLKRPGAWWRTHNTEHMLALRLNRGNHRWYDYWKNSFREAA